MLCLRRCLLAGCRLLFVEAEAGCGIEASFGCFLVLRKSLEAVGGCLEFSHASLGYACCDFLLLFLLGLRDRTRWGSDVSRRGIGRRRTCLGGLVLVWSCLLLSLGHLLLLALECLKLLSLMLHASFKLLSLVLHFCLVLLSLALQFIEDSL